MRYFGGEGYWCVGYARTGRRLRGRYVLLSGRGMRTLGGGVESFAEGETEPSSWSGGIRCSGMRRPFTSSTELLPAAVGLVVLRSAR
jgi:hypothetical protein